LPDTSFGINQGQEYKYITGLEQAMSQQSINRRNFLKGAGAIALGVGLGAGGYQIRRYLNKPNIVLIMADDLGYECLGSYGGTSYETPHLDRLAEEGMRFEHCYSQPLCTPSRVELMTGMYNVRNYERFNVLNKNQTTFGNIFQNNGYSTCISGKWQLTPRGIDRTESPELFGFDEYCLWAYDKDGRKSPRPKYKNPVLIINGRKLAFKNNLYGPDVVSEYILRFMERHKYQPFLAYYPMILPHKPDMPTPDSGPVYYEQLDKKGNDKYFPDMVKYADKLVGKIIARLDELNIREKTLVIFTGDNGTQRGLASKINGKIVKGGKGMPTDAGTRVPLIASWPGVIAPGTVNSELIDFSDFLPTMCECAEIEIPKALPIDGKSFMPMLRGDEQKVREWVYSWYQTVPGAHYNGEIFIYARNKRYKLYDDGRFFDIANDVLEENPVDISRLDEEAMKTRNSLQKVLDYYQEVDSQSDRGLWDSL